MDLAHTPLIAPPPGTVSNFADPESNGHALIIVVSICCSLMLPVVALRVYSRCWVKRYFALDDGKCPSQAALRLLRTASCFYPRHGNPPSI